MRTRLHVIFGTKCSDMHKYITSTLTTNYSSDCSSVWTSGSFKVLSVGQGWDGLRSYRWPSNQPRAGSSSTGGHASLASKEGALGRLYKKDSFKDDLFRALVLDPRLGSSPDQRPEEELTHALDILTDIVLRLDRKGRWRQGWGRTDGLLSAQMPSDRHAMLETKPWIWILWR